MAKGHRTGGRQKGHAKQGHGSAQCEIGRGDRAGDRWSIKLGSRFHVAAGRHALRNGLELQGGHWRSAATIAEKAAPYVHPKMAPRTEDGGGEDEVTIKIVGGLPE
jgi:hypothetical protein